MSDLEEYGGEARTVSTFDQDADDYAVTLQDINEVLGFIGNDDDDDEGEEELQDDTSEETAKPSSAKSVFTFALDSDVICTLALARDLEELHLEEIATMNEYIASREDASAEMIDDSASLPPTSHRSDSSQWIEDFSADEDYDDQYDKRIASSFAEMSDDDDYLTPDSYGTPPSSTEWLDTLVEEEEEAFPLEPTVKTANPAAETVLQADLETQQPIIDESMIRIESLVETPESYSPKAPPKSEYVTEEKEIVSLKQPKVVSPKSTQKSPVASSMPSRKSPPKSQYVKKYGETLALKGSPITPPKPAPNFKVRNPRVDPTKSDKPQQTVESIASTVVEVAIPPAGALCQAATEHNARFKIGVKESRQYKAAKMYKKRVTFSSEDIDQYLFRKRHEWVMKAIAMAKKRKKHRPEYIIVTIGTATEDGSKDTWKLKKSVAEAALPKNNFIDLIQDVALAGKIRLEKRYGPAVVDLPPENRRDIFANNVIAVRHSFSVLETKATPLDLARKTSWSPGDPLPVKQASFRLQPVQKSVPIKKPKVQAPPIGGPNPLMNEMILKAKQRQARVQGGVAQMQSAAPVPRPRVVKKQPAMAPLVDDTSTLQNEETVEAHPKPSESQVKQQGVKKRRSVMIAKHYFKFSSRNKKCAEF